MLILRAVFINDPHLVRKCLNDSYTVCGPYAAFHGLARKCHFEGSMLTAIWTHLRMFLNSKFYLFMFKCWILPVLRVVDGILHLIEPSINRLNQTEPATFSILTFWAFFRDSYPLSILSSKMIYYNIFKERSCVSLYINLW
jgi:hypothetical protein